jgi:hypothetical protein
MARVLGSATGAPAQMTEKERADARLALVEQGRLLDKQYIDFERGSIEDKVKFAQERSKYQAELVKMYGNIANNDRALKVSRNSAIQSAYGDIQKNLNTVLQEQLGQSGVADERKALIASNVAGFGKLVSDFRKQTMGGDKLQEGTIDALTQAMRSENSLDGRGAMLVQLASAVGLNEGGAEPSFEGLMNAVATQAAETSDIGIKEKLRELGAVLEDTSVDNAEAYARGAALMDVALLQSNQYKDALKANLSGSAGFDKGLFDAIDASLNPEAGGGFEAVAAATPEKAAGMPDAAKDQLAGLMDKLDSPDAQVDPTLRQVKDSIMADPAFQEYASQFGGDPESVFKHLTKQAKQERRVARHNTRQNLKQADAAQAKPPAQREETVGKQLKKNLMGILAPKAKDVSPEQPKTKAADILPPEDKQRKGLIPR